jgi:hypothetical protein
VEDEEAYLVADLRHMLCMQRNLLHEDYGEAYMVADLRHLLVKQRPLVARHLVADQLVVY